MKKYLKYKLKYINLKNGGLIGYPASETAASAPAPPPCLVINPYL